MDDLPCSIVTTYDIEIACYKIRIKCYFNSSLNFFENYQIEIKNPDIVIQLTQNDINTELISYMKAKREAVNIALLDVFSRNAIVPSLVFNRLADTFIPRKVILLHGSVVALNNLSYIFIAPSGVGKSTRTRIWMNLYPESIVVNGDKPFIKVTDTQLLACGSPWCGKEGWNTNTTVPLRAIFILERVTEGEDNSIEELSAGKAFPALLQQTYIPKDVYLAKTVINLLKDFTGKVKFYKFRSAPTAEAVRLAYETARP